MPVLRRPVDQFREGGVRSLAAEHLPKHPVEVSEKMVCVFCLLLCLCEVIG